MIRPSDITAALMIIAAIVVLITVPACWFVVRTGSSRTAGNARQASRRIRITSKALLGLGGFIVVCGLIGLSFMAFARSDDVEIGLTSASTCGGVLICLVGVIMQNTAKSIGRLAGDTDDDLQISIDRLIGSVAFIGWAIVVLCLLPGLFLAPFTLIFLLLILFIGVPLTLQLVRARRQCQLLWMIAVTIRSSRNLPTELRNHAGCTFGNNAASIRQLARDLETGLPLGDALLVNREKSYRGSRLWRLFVRFNPVSLVVWFFFGPSLILPAWVIASIQTAEKSGTLEKTLAVCSKQYLDSIRTRFTLSNVTGLIAYLLAYASVAAGVVSFLMVYIMPKFKAIFGGFGTELPSSSESLIWCADYAINYWPVFILIGLYPFRMLIRLGLGEPLAWKNLNSKIFAKLFPKLDAPDVLRQLSAVVRSGRPLNDALSAMAKTHQRKSARSRLNEVYEGVQAGGDAWELLTKGGYLRGQDLQLLRVATDAGNLPWALDELASSRERALEHQVQMASSFIEPAVIVAFGLLCGFIIIGFFMPVVKLVNDLS